MTQRRINFLESGSISDADRIGYERVAGLELLGNNTVQVAIKQEKQAERTVIGRTVRLRKWELKML